MRKILLKTTAKQKIFDDFFNKIGVFKKNAVFKKNLDVFFKKIDFLRAMCYNSSEKFLKVTIHSTRFNEIFQNLNKQFRKINMQLR